MNIDEFNPFSLKGKKILVTGASSGIGQAIAIQSSKMGASVIISARNKERLQETFENLDKSYDQEHEIACIDLIDNDQLCSLVDKIKNLDGLVNCAGIAKPLLYKFAKPEYIREIMEVNFFSSAILTQKLLQMKKIKKGSSIVFLSSISGTEVTILGESLYSASKGAINGLVKGIALEYAPQRIRVNAITPGMVDTHILDSEVISEEQLNEDRKHYPLGRYGKPEDIANAAVYLLSDASSWVTGSNLLIDGGYTLQ